MARRDCPSCGTYLVMMSTTERTPWWRCFGRPAHRFELGPDSELVQLVGQLVAPRNDGHKARVADAIDRVSAKHADALDRLGEL